MVSDHHVSTEDAARTIRANAKVNLFLEVTRKRPDGFHDIDSVFQEIDLADELTLEIDASGRLTLECDAPGVPTDDRNLVVRAAELLRAESGRRDAGARMTLRKRIPAGGGLGGGSADAAAALVGLDALWKTHLPRRRLAEAAATLGSDVPFFLSGGVCRCTGRGERVEPIASKTRLTLVVVMPEWSVSTAEAYAAFSRDAFGRRNAEAMTAALASGDAEAVAAASFNRFEDVVGDVEPRADALLASLRELDFAAVRLSGSGAACFGIVRPGVDAGALAEQTAALKGVRNAVVATTVSRARSAG